MQMTDPPTLSPDIPLAPEQVYKNSGWNGYGDWLGTGAIAPQLKNYQSFTKARTFVRSLSLQSQKEWFQFCKGLMPSKGALPKDIPANPHNTYRNRGWKSFGDWLGTGTIAPQFKKYRSFKEARTFARFLNLKSQREWRQFCNGQMPSKGILPIDIPANPNQTYKNKGWINLGDWLGTEKVANFKRTYRSFVNARTFARSLNLNSQREWFQFCKGQMPEKGTLPKDMPSSPSRVYKNLGWNGFGDWLGTGTISPQFKKYRSFKEARAFARSLNLKSYYQWCMYCKGQMPEKETLPQDIPLKPQRTYQNKGWKSMGDWLGTENVATFLRSFKSFHEARSFVHSLKLKSHREWVQFCKGQMPNKDRLPQDIPTAPGRIYKNLGWNGFGDWLGTGSIANFNKTFSLFKEARAFAHSLKLKSTAEWRQFCRGQLPEKGTRPSDIPSTPERTYFGKGWRGYGDWLGKR